MQQLNLTPEHRAQLREALQTQQQRSSGLPAIAYVGIGAVVVFGVWYFALR